MTTRADILLKGGKVINVNSRSIDRVDVGIIGNTFNLNATEGKSEIDCSGLFISPSFIDAHMHVESTMLPPSSFANLSIPHGTTAAILDPHEIANVMGISGIQLIMEDAIGIPLDCFFMASSCVPASPLETSGATLLAQDLEPLFQDKRMLGLAEMMNYPGVLHDDAEIKKKIALGNKYGLVDGHCPGLRGKDLLKYIAAGITSDHESTTSEEAQEKLDAGMQIYIREGSAANNLEALLPIITQENARQICFCTDDRHPADLQHEGHIDHIVRKAISLGLDPVLAICIASKNVAVHFKLKKYGAIVQDMFANFVLFDDLEKPTPKEVWHRGELVAKDGEMCQQIHSTTDWTSAKHSVHIPNDFSEASLEVQGTAPKIRVIGVIPKQLFTEELHLDATIENGYFVSNSKKDILKLAVIERHHKTGNIGIGFVHGFHLKNGAIASTVGHDAHNVTVVGDNDNDMCVAVKALAEAGGGQCVVQHGELLSLLPLPIAGLMSDAPPNEVILQQQKVLKAANSLGCKMKDPFMPLSFLSLSVIPKLKLSDLGLIDVDQFKIVPLEISNG